MAKPGSAHARQIANGGAVNLDRAAMTDERAAEYQEMIEVSMGMRCAGCFRRIGMGFRFRSLDPREEGHEVIEQVACNREDCDHAMKCREGATVVEMIEFAWCDPAGVDARPAAEMVRRRERRQARTAPAQDD